MTQVGSVQAQGAERRGALFGPRLGVVPALDGLRAVAVTLVLLLHLDTPGFSGGGIGVDIFFALSGFLITTLLLEERAGHGDLHLAKFYGRRALRLFPALALLLIAVALVEVVRPGGTDSSDFAASAFYVSNWVTALGGNLGLLRHTWSLAVEEQFYIVWPIVLLIVARRGTNAVIAAAGALLSASIAVRAVLWVAHATPDRIYAGTDTAGAQILWGCLFAAILQTPQQRRLIALCRACFAPAALWLTVVVIHGVKPNWHWYAVGYPVIGLAAAVIVTALATDSGRLSHALSWRPARLLGLVSYGLYLWHYPIAQLMPARIQAHAVTRYPAIIGLSLVACVASYRLIEKPLQRWFRPYVTRGDADRPIPVSGWGTPVADSE